jgi:hypothetical protein
MIAVLDIIATNIASESGFAADIVTIAPLRLHDAREHRMRLSVFAGFASNDLDWQECIAFVWHDCCVQER